MLRLSRRSLRLRSSSSAMNFAQNAAHCSQNQRHDQTSIPAIGEPATFVLDTSRPIKTQIHFDDEMDELFASVPEEQLDQYYHSRRKISSPIAGPSRHEVIDVDEYETAYEEDIELDDIFASVDESLLVNSQLVRDKVDDKENIKPVYDLTHSPPHSPTLMKAKIRSTGTGNRWSGQPIRFYDDVPRHRSALQQDILNTLNPVIKKDDNYKARQYSTAAVASASSSDTRARPPSMSNRARTVKASGRKGFGVSKLPSTKELERQEREAGLSIYSYLRPAGKIESMRKSSEEARNDLSSLIAKASGSRTSEMVISTHRSPRLQVLSSAKSMDEELKVIESGEALSFDMEWPFSKSFATTQQKTSIIQIASASDIFILQVGKMTSLPKELIRIIRDPSIIKCGVAIRNDAIKLKKDFGMQATLVSMVELSTMAKIVDSQNWKGVWHLIALRDLCRVYLNKKLDKDIKVRAGPWGSTILDQKQKDYAASDAYVGLEILYSLASMVSDKRTGLLTQAEVIKVLEKSKCAPLHEPLEENEEVRLRSWREKMEASTIGEKSEGATESSSSQGSVYEVISNAIVSAKALFGFQKTPSKMEDEKMQLVKNLSKSDNAQIRAFEERIDAIPNAPIGSTTRNKTAIGTMRDLDLETNRHRMREEWQNARDESTLKFAHDYQVRAPDIRNVVLWSLSTAKVKLSERDQRRITGFLQWPDRTHLIETYGEYLASQDVDLHLSPDRYRHWQRSEGGSRRGEGRSRSSSEASHNSSV